MALNLLGQTSTSRGQEELTRSEVECVMCMQRADVLQKQQHHFSDIAKQHPVLGQNSVIKLPADHRAFPQSHSIVIQHHQCHGIPSA